MKHYLFPCFIVVEANSIVEADKLAERHCIMKNGSVLLLDKELPTVEIKVDKDHEYPHTIKGLIEV